MRWAWFAGALICAVMAVLIVAQSAPLFLGLPYEGKFAVVLFTAMTVAGAVGCWRQARG
jgi:hypothetical protein